MAKNTNDRTTKGRGAKGESQINGMQSGKSQPTRDEMQRRISKLEEEIKSLALTIDEVEDEKQAIREQLLKALADYDNLSKSIDTRIDMRLQQLRVDLGKDVINVMDDVRMAENALQNVELTPAGRAWAEGVVATLKKLGDALAKLGLEVIPVKKGDKFDANMHEAIGVVNEGADNTIHEVIQQGYKSNDNIVRPAKVLVNKANK